MFHAEKDTHEEEDMESQKRQGAEYEFYGKLPLKKAIPLGLQHVLAMFVGNLTPILIISGACGIAGEEFGSLQVDLLQNAMLIAGIVTLIQLFAIGPVGGKVPIIMGTSSGFIGVFNSVVQVMGGGILAYGAIMCASVIGGLFEGILGFLLKPLRRFFPAVVTGTVVLSIGLSLIAVGVNSFGGGNTANDFGSVENLLLGAAVLLIIVAVKHWMKGMASASSILIGIVAGYIIAAIMGLVLPTTAVNADGVEYTKAWVLNWDKVANAAWFSVPKLMPVKLVFDWRAIIPVLIMFVVTAVETVGDIYGPCYFYLESKKPKPCLKELSNKYGISPKSVFFIVKRYLMSGLDPFSLLSQTGKKSKSGLHYSTKTGRPPMFEQGIPLTDELREIFDDCCKHYLSGREKSYATTYDWMLTKYFTARVETQTSKGVVVQNKLLPIDQRPTKSQMENYIVTHTSAKARRVCKTSKREYRNNERMLVSDNLLNVHGPGDLFEMDEVEMDVSIVSEVDPTKVIGRPIVHAMVDVYSRMITAVSVSLENNSVLGFTNCLLNLGEDNKQLCRRYGLELKDGLWNINVLPNRLRSDRGSEYRSKEVKRICNELNITLELVPPAMGSLKGQVEQLFHQYHSVQNDLLEGRGLITKRYDSNHHRHAVLTLDDIWVFVINQTIAHNMMTMSQYPMTKDMLEKSVHPIPLELWDYGCTKYGAPRPIVNLDQFEYSIRKEVRARITRKGIEWNGLYYIANDPWLAEQITKTRRSSVPLKCRLDERNIGSLWYIADNRLVKATLNENRAGNYEFNGMSLRNYEEYKTKKKELVMEKAQEDQEIRCARRMGMQATLDDAVRVANQTAPNDDKAKNI